MRSDPKLVPRDDAAGRAAREVSAGQRQARVRGSDAGTFIGTLDIAALHDTPPEEEPDRRIAGDFATDPDLFLLPFENVRTALLRFEEKEVETLPVLASGSDRGVVGYLTEHMRSGATTRSWSAAAAPNSENATSSRSPSRRADAFLPTS